MLKFQYVPILVLLLAFQTPVQSQQIPFLNHYTWNPRLFNPASQGADGNGEITAIYRSQFQNLEAADRPNTYLIHADLSPWMPKRIGIAAQVMGDKAHLISRFQFSGFFGYHLLQGSHLRFSLGAAASVLTQNIDFDGRRISDILDLSVFNGQVNNSQFDGGPGLELEYHTENGSFFALDLAATQLFSSDIRIDGTPNNTRNGALYDMLPHFLANARVRIQGKGFAIEPTAAFRALGGDRPLKSGVFDLNLNAYFLNNNRLMVGAGMRSNKGGVHFQLGIMPTTAIRLLASAELHPALGPSYEFGASYTFGRASQNRNAPVISTTPPEDLLEGASQEIQALATALEEEFPPLKNEQRTVRTEMEAAALQNRKQQTEAADACTIKLAEIGQKLDRMRQTAQALDVKRLQAEQIVRSATRQGGISAPSTIQTLKAIQERNLIVLGSLQELMNEQQILLRQCTELQPETSVAACVQNGDYDCIKELFGTELEALTGRPATMYPLRIFAATGSAAITYHFPNDEEVYLLSAEQQTLAAHLVKQVRAMQAESLVLDKIALVSELQEDRGTLGYRLALQYAAELGETPILYTLVDNESGIAEPQNMLIGTGSRISLESLAVLKLSAWKKYLVEQGLPSEKISLELRYNHTANIYREETKVVLRFQN